ncbi:MAG: dienelactone hydrolase family protein [Pseudomonadota bacterium]
MRKRRVCLGALVLVTALLSACGDSSAPTAPTDSRPAGQAGPAEQPSSGPADVSADRRDVVSESLAYAEVDERLVYGHFVIPVDMIEPLPAVIMIHDWWGLNEQMRALCDELAAQGYIVLGVDLFAGGTAASAADARQLEIAVVENPDLAAENLRQAFDFVSNIAAAPSVAAVGYGFGGSWSLNAAVDLQDRLAAAALYYGQVSSDRGFLAAIDAPVLGFFAGNDRAVPADTVAAFRDALAALEKDHEVIMFDGVRRGFADPQSANYDAGLAQDAWGQLLTFLDTNLGAGTAN